MILRTLYLVSTVALLGLLVLTCERTAFAYADPGSGLVVLQSLSAIAAGAMFYLRTRLRMLIFGSQSGIGSSSPPADAAQSSVIKKH